MPTFGEENMEKTDYDMKIFEDRIRAVREDLSGALWAEPSQIEKTYFISDNYEGNAYCMEYELSTAQELFDKFHRFLNIETTDESLRKALIRSCVASCFKYAGQEHIPDDGGEISEFIYEF